MPKSGWTVDTVHEHLTALYREKDLRDQQRFDAQQLALRDALISQEKAVNAALSAAQEAVQKAETAAEKRFDSVNEFRAQLADQTATLLPRREYDAQHKALEDRMALIEQSTNKSAGRTDAIPWLVGLASVLVALAALAYALTS